FAIGLPPASRAVTVMVAALEPLLAVIGDGSAVTVVWLADTGPGLILNATDFPAVIPVAVALSVYPEPDLSICRSSNVATPATAPLAPVPPNVPPPGLSAIVRFPVPVKVTLTFPNGSFAVTSTAGVIVDPATARLGCTVKNSAPPLAGMTVTV